MLPLAPALFSTTTGWPSACESLSPRARAARSVEPPGGNPTSSFTGRSGQPWADASEVAKARQREMRSFMGSFQGSELQSEISDLPFVHHHAQARALRHQGELAFHGQRLGEVIAGDVLRPVQVARIVDAVAGEEVHRCREADRRIHQAA